MRDRATTAAPLWKTPAIVTALALLIPILGQIFVDGWHWLLRGFVLFGVVVFAMALTYQFVTRNVDSTAYRMALGVALVAAFVLLWMNRVQAADDVNPHALLFFLVPVVALVAVAFARFRPAGMVRALFVTALAQALILAFTLITLHSDGVSWVRALGLNGFVLVLFVASALLFRSAARKVSPRQT